MQNGSFQFIKLIFIILIFGIATFSSQICLAADSPEIYWPMGGIVINDTPGGSIQKNPKIVSVGDGYIAVWEDGRSGYFNLFVQKISKDGALKWDRNGIPVAKAPKNQSLPEIISDKAGGAIIVWEDYRRGHSDIYAQRIDGFGAALWKKEGVPVCEAVGAQLSPKLTSDGSGGAIITWHDYRGGKAEDIFAQRIDAFGNVLWETDGVAIATAQGTQWYPRIAGDGDGGAVITWTDFRSGTTSDIYAQKVNKLGKILWQQDGAPVCSASENQADPEIVLDKTGSAIISWRDQRAGNSDIYIQKLNITGQSVWKKDGIAVSSSAFNEDEPRMVFDGVEGAIVVWKEKRIEGDNIYTTRIGGKGEILWSESPRIVCKEKDRRGRIFVDSSERGGIVIAWEDKREKNLDIFVQKINSQGNMVWADGGVSVAKTKDDQENPQIIGNGEDGAVVIWQDKRFGNPDIYAQRIDQSGRFNWDSDGIVINSSSGSVSQQAPVVRSDGRDNYIVVWEDNRSGYTDIYAQKVDSAGSFLWERDGTPVCTAWGLQRNPKLLCTKGEAFIIWEDYREENPKIYVQKINSDGKALWSSDGLPISSGKYPQMMPEIISDGAGGIIIVWQEQRAEKKRYDIIGQRIDTAGNKLWGDEGCEICGFQSDQENPKIIEAANGGVIVTWADYRSGINNSDIYAQKIDINGKSLWKKDGIPVCEAPDVQRDPQISASGDGAIIVWSDKGGGEFDIYAQRIDGSGRNLWRKDGVPVCNTTGTQREPRITNDSSEGALIVWEDYRYANWDIYAQRIDKNGQLMWPPEGVPVCNAASTQYAPDIASDGENGAMVAWEDYRGGLGYNIYAQKIKADGKPAWQQNGAAVCDLPGGQRNPKITKNGHGGAVIVWEDYRGGGYGIYAQRIRIIRLQ